MQITQCLHAAILVSDLERAEQFYGNVLGLPKVDRQLKFTGAWYQIGNFQIHLIENRDVAIALSNVPRQSRGNEGTEPAPGLFCCLLG